jgi:hypothetical protein
MQLTQLDIEYLRRGNNNLIELAQQHANQSEHEFLQAVFASDWNTAAGPTEKPVKARRVAADAGMPCGVFVRDAYNKVHPSTDISLSTLVAARDSLQNIPCQQFRCCHKQKFIQYVRRKQITPDDKNRIIATFLSLLTMTPLSPLTTKLVTFSVLL